MMGLSCVDGADGEGEQLGAAGSDLVGQAQVAARIDGDTDLRFGEGEEGVFGGDPDVAHQCQLSGPDRHCRRFPSPSTKPGTHSRPTRFW
jgi:hypothetical protein